MKSAVRAAVARLRVDSTTAEVLRSLDAAGVQTILLKGASTRRWLRERGGGRAYADSDLLVRPGDANAAARVLGDLGFVAELDVQQMPSWWREHGVAWMREGDCAIVDLHRTLPGVCVDESFAWELLSRGAEHLAVGGYPTRVLALPARAMHLALHAAHHGPNASLVLDDLERALELADESTWKSAAELAYRLGAMEMFLAGLRLVPAGRALDARLGASWATPTEVELLSARSRSEALTIERFVSAPDLSTRMSMIRYKLIPPKTFIEHWSPLARHGRAGLLVAYAWRPVWVLRRVPSATAAWRKARQRARNTRAQ